MSGTYINIPVSSGGGGGGGLITAVVDTDSIDLTVSSGILSADLLLSGNAASVGSFKSTVTIQNSASHGLHVENPVATALQTGVLLAADWSTFNSKEPAIAAGTTAQYYRGDKTFQTLQVSAMTAIVAGTAAATGAIGEVLVATQAANTTTGVAASGSYGAVTSVSLTAGAWYVTGVAGFNENGAVLIDGLQCGVSASATGAGISEFDTSLFPGLLSSTSDLLLGAPGVFVDISSTTTYYLNTKFSYTAGTPRHRGQIKAWRIR